ncbi:MAG: cytochrome c [Elusimicrobia bacterium]|nr:cytochrome c [Elusimicrobiota bacterium]
MLKGIIMGAAGSAAAALLGAYLFITLGGMPANADAEPSRLERWAARKSLRATIRRESPKGPNPEALSDENLLAGVRLYAIKCAECHGAADGKASSIAKGLFQKPPQFAEEGVEDDPEGATFWKILHGIRLTGMPSHRNALSERQIWQLTLFLKHMDGLTPAAGKAWKDVPSQAEPSK